MSTLTIDAPTLRTDAIDPTFPDPVRFADDLESAMRDVLARVEAWLGTCKSGH